MPVLCNGVHRPFFCVSLINLLSVVGSELHVIKFLGRYSSNSHIIQVMINIRLLLLSVSQTPISFSICVSQCCGSEHQFYFGLDKARHLYNSLVFDILWPRLIS